MGKIEEGCRYCGRDVEKALPNVDPRIRDSMLYMDKDCYQDLTAGGEEGKQKVAQRARDREQERSGATVPPPDRPERRAELDAVAENKERAHDVRQIRRDRGLERRHDPSSLRLGNEGQGNDGHDL